MRLLKLVLSGFKSFADRTEIVFPEGITMIVGPNGCGKSNISDAVRWVLGEQNVRNLRGQRTEDIIFSGSVSRKAKNGAEVTMVLDNAAHELSPDSAEVSVTRRVLRNGDSEFFINQRACRLRDIQELFANTGLGRASLAIIGQNRVDRILSARPEERRQIFEEVAGISRYRMQKEDGLSKLKRTSDNMDRVKDLMAVLSEQLAPMKEAAEKAKALHTLALEKQALEATDILQRLASVRKSIERRQTELAEAADAKAAAETKLSVLEAARAEIELRCTGLDDTYRRLSEKIADGQREEERLRGDYRVKETEISHIREAAARLSETLADNRQNLTDLAADIEEAAAELVEAKKNLAAAAEALAQAETEKQEAERVAKAAEEEYRVQMEALRERQILRERHTRDLSFAEAEKERLASLLQEQDAARRQAEEQLLQCRAQLAELTKKQETEKEETEALSAKERETSQAAKKAAEESFALLSRFNAAKSALAQLVSHREYLERTEKEQANFSHASRSVLRADEAWQDGVWGALGDLIRVPEAYTDAAEAILGAMVSHIVTDTQETAAEIIRWMKQNRVGRTTFYPLDAMKPRFRDERERQAASEPGVLGIAADLFTADAALTDLKRALFGRILIVEDLDVGKKLARKYQFQLHIVTRDGQMLRPGGAMTGGSLQKRENTFFGRKREIAALYKEQKIKEKELADWEAKRREAEEEAARLSEMGSTLREQCLQKQTELAADAARAEALSREEKTAEAAAQRFTETLEKLREESAQNEAKMAALSAMLSQMAETEETLPTGQEEASRRLAEMTARVTELSVSKVRAEEALRRAEETCGDRETERQELVSEIEAAEKQIAARKEEETKALAVLAEWNEQFEAARLAREAVVKERESLESGKSAALAERNENEASRREAQAALLSAEAAQTEKTLQLETAQRREEEEQANLRILGFSETEAQAVRRPESARDVSEKLTKIRADMDALGLVNPNAEAEYEAARERYQNYETQSADLAKAAAGLEKVIAGIDAAMAKEFTEAFAKINQEFGRIMGIMFPGGRGKLELTDAANPLECGVEMYLDLPGKKRQPMTLMSGGERALTVIALLISFLAFRPAPFCFVDEIDAALDDANVERFSRLMAEYKKRSQFIVITHRKKTMEFADTLQGVTMGEKGVSALVTVEMKDYVE